MAESMEQFGNRIKAKYPDYKDIDPVELAQKVIAKYPEYKDAVISDGPSDPYGRPLARAEVVREEYPSEKFARYAEPISQFGGMFAKKGPMGAAIAGATTMGAEIAKQGIQAIGSEPGTPTGFMESGKRIASAFGRGAAGEAMGRGVFAGAGALAAKAAPSMQKTGAQMMKVSAGIPEKTGEKVLKDMSRLGKARPASETGAAYGRAMEATGLDQGPEAAMELMGKEGLGLKGAEEYAFDAIKRLKQGGLTYQEALVARDQLKGVLEMPRFQNPKTNQQFAFLKKMQTQLDDYLEPYFQEAGQSFSTARKDYSESMLAKDFESWLPTNANKTASFVRAGVGAGLAGGGYATDSPMVTGIGLAAMSPRMLGYGIRAGAAAAPLLREGAKAGVRLGTQEIAGNYLPSSTEELLRKKYEEQR